MSTGKLVILNVALLMLFSVSACKYNRPLKRELTTIWNEDQDLRYQLKDAWKEAAQDSSRFDSLMTIMSRQDSIHLVRVKAILDEKGWIGKDEIGKKANQTLSLVIQHSDLKTQQQYLPMMREAVKNGKSEPYWLALLEDRVALGEERRQIYGSQGYMDKNSGKIYVAPLEDPDHVDERRKEVGLNSMSSYVKMWNIEWNVEEYKKQLPELEKLYWNR